MYIDGRNIDNNTQFETDVCIIGAGAAGISCALSFREKPYSICILESGGFEYEPDIQNLYDGEALQTYEKNNDKFTLRKMPEYLISSRLRYFGGTTNHWSGMCRPLNSIDFETRKGIPYSGWPITRDELMPFYDRASSLVEISSFGNNDIYEEVKDRFYQIGDGSLFENKLFYFGPPTRFGERYYKDLDTAGNIRVYYHSSVTRLIVDNINSAVDKVEVATLNKNKFFVKAKIFILATGGIENARLLLNSNTERGSGLGNENDLVGRFFMEHIEHEFGGMYVNSPQNSLYFYGKPHFLDKHKHSVFPALFINENVQRDRNLLSCSIRFDHWNMNENKPAYLPLSKFNKQIINYSRSLDRLLEIKQNNPIKRLLNDDVRFTKVATYAQLFIAQEHAPNPESRVLLDKVEDAFGANKAKLDWRISDFELNNVKQHLMMLAQELGRTFQGRIFLNFDFENPKAVGYGWHHMGTTRMHNKSSNGVVDKTCKLHSVTNCYIAGSSVFPTCGSINPTLTIVALSLRIADTIVKKLEG